MTHIMKVIFLVLALSLVGWKGHAMSYESGRKLFLTGEGVWVTLVYLKSENKFTNKVLIKVENSHSELDGKIIMHEASENDGKINFVNTKEKNYTTIIYYRQYERYELWVPNRDKPIKMKLDDVESRRISGENLVKDYLQKGGK